MKTRKELISDRVGLQDRVYGALIGLAIGDSLGDAARKPENRANYGFTTDFTGEDSWSTDDTEFALLTAQTLIDCGGELTSEHVVAAWRTHVVTEGVLNRGGASETEAAMNLRRGLMPPLTGKYNAFHMSDGAAMRIAPIGIFCAGDPEKAAAMAETDAAVSHWRDGIWGAQAVAAAVAAAMADADIDEIIKTALNVIPEESWLFYAMNRALEIVSDGGIIDVWMPLHDELRTTSWATTAEAIPSAFACLYLEHSDFKRGLTLAANFARDADTIGAVAGAVLGAKYGASSIPERWKERTRRPTGTCLSFTNGLDIEDMARKLCERMV